LDIWSGNIFKNQKINLFQKFCCKKITL
jgi:hypothetical protein